MLSASRSPVESSRRSQNAKNQDTEFCRGTHHFEGGLTSAEDVCRKQLINKAANARIFRTGFDLKRLTNPGREPAKKRTRYDNRAARRSAASRLSSFALPFHAMSSAVPWSTLVRRIGRPSVVFTALSNASAFTGMCP